MNDLIGFLYDTFSVLFAIFLIGLLITVTVLWLRFVIKCIRDDKGAQK